MSGTHISAPAGDSYGPIYKRLAVGAFTEMAIDGSTVAVAYEWTCPTDGPPAHIHRLNQMILDSGVSPNEFGGLSALTNGIKVEVIDTDGSTVLLDYTDGEPIKTNAQWSLLAGTDVSIDGAAVTDAVYIRWTLSKAGHALRLYQGQSFRLTVQDDLTGLISYKAMIQGSYLP